MDDMNDIGNMDKLDYGAQARETAASIDDAVAAAEAPVPAPPARPAFQGAPPPAGVALSDEALQHLVKTRGWVRFFGVLTFIMAGFMLLGGLGVFAVGILSATTLSSSSSSMPSMAVGAMTGLLYIVMALLYIPPGLYLNRYAGSISDLERNRTAEALEDALKHQKSFWRYVGIFAIVGFCAMVLFSIVAVFAAVVLGIRGGM